MRRPGGRIELGHVMRHVDREPVALELGQLRRQLEELLHADGKIRAIEKGSALLRFAT